MFFFIGEKWFFTLLLLVKNIRGYPVNGIASLYLEFNPRHFHGMRANPNEPVFQFRTVEV